MADTVVTLTQKVGEEGKLYGSVTTMDIAAQLRNFFDEL
jgi:ribosomal protein L9